MFVSNLISFPCRKIQFLVFFVISRFQLMQVYKICGVTLWFVAVVLFLLRFLFIKSVHQSFE